MAEHTIVTDKNTSTIIGGSQIIRTTYKYSVKVVKKSDPTVALRGASVTFKMDAGDKTIVTGSNGIATNIIPSDSNAAPSILLCDISLSGYKSQTTAVRRSETVTPTPIELEELSECRYYSIMVVDNINGAPVSDITVYMCLGDVKISTATTSSSGVCLFTVELGTGTLIPEDNIFSFKAEKNGYISNIVSNSGGSTIGAAIQNRGTIVISEQKTKTYYYTVSVVDEGNNPVKGAQLRLYKDFNFQTPYIIKQKVRLNTKIHEYIIPLSKNIELAKNDIYYTLKKIFADDLGYDVSEIPNNFNIWQSFGFENKIRDKFSIPSDVVFSFVHKGLGNGQPYVYEAETIDDLYHIITENIKGSTIDITIVETGEDGNTNPITLENLSVIPLAIYAEGISLPNGYSWKNNHIRIFPITSLNNIVHIVVSSTNVGTYYYYLQLIDDVTGKSISDANVTYSYGNSVVFSAQSDDNGLVQFSSNYSSLYTSISKNGYSDNNFQIIGNESKKYYLIKCVPDNIIRVIYKAVLEDSDSDPDTSIPIPAAGVFVEIFALDGNNKITIKTTQTNTNGYIETLNADIYQSNNVYVSVTDYNVIKNLVPGILIIEVDRKYEDSDSDDDSIDDLFSAMSINNIKKNIELGNQALEKNPRAKTISYSDDSFRINILDPDSVNTYDIFTGFPVLMNENQKNVIGSVDMGIKSDLNDLRLKVINRYSGYYNPIFKDLVFYNNLNYTINTSGSDSDSDSDSDGINIIEQPFSNTSFDYNYSDYYGKFGIINNMWFHKANDNKDIDVVTSLTPYYPLTGQYALDFKDYNIFSSTWDRNYYTKQTDINTSEPCQNTASMKNGLCMFGSKYLNVPNTIEIFGFDLGKDINWNGEWNDEWIINSDACPGEVMFKEVNNNSVDYYFFFRKRILRFFYEKLKDEFEKYIPSDFSFGKPGLEDDIYEYVTKNVLKLYKLEKVRVFVRRTKIGQHNSKVENDYIKYLGVNPSTGTPYDISYFRQHGFIEINNIFMNKLNRDDFDRKITYNLKRGIREEFAFGFILKKI